MKKSKYLETSAKLKIKEPDKCTSAELQVNHNNADLLSELFLKKIE